MRDSMQKKNKNKPYFSRQQYKAPVVYSWVSTYFILVIEFVRKNIVHTILSTHHNGLSTLKKYHGDSMGLHEFFIIQL